MKNLANNNIQSAGRGMHYMMGILLHRLLSLYQWDDIDIRMTSIA